ncbi:MAG TPA: D-glycero-beta-D-manno-heptose 1-phosphate adenylyltransferase [Actinomycetota bacterium]|nr:D-glycero-beta-D-manno-heptose 1-phosphate adenylyltransferase [Actinomycetota bacterium]
MSETLASVVDRFDRLSVLVLGESILDVYLRGSSTRLCREAPVPVVDVAGRAEAPGGAANAAVNARALGARVTFLSVVGDDREGAAVLALLAEAGVDARRVLVRPGRRTLAKHRVVADGQVLVRFDEGGGGATDEGSDAELAELLAAEAAGHDAVLVSDYGYGVLGAAVAGVLRRLQAEAPRVLVVDARHPTAYRGVGATAVKPNYDEAVQLLGGGRFDPRGSRADQLERQGRRILSLLGAEVAAVTLDTEGAVLFERDGPPYRTYARPAASARAAGAGDTFSSALTLALAAGAGVPAAGELASAAAAVVVAADGTAVCPRAALEEAVGGDRRIVTAAELAARASLYRRQGRRIVFTNGCFDILHRGHITYLNRAKTLGDVLVVGVNADAGVRRLKGPDRPLNALDDRMAVLAALSCIDHLVAFEDDTPAELIRAVRPDVFVKGGDYRRDTVPEGPLVESLGGAVEILPFLEARSTTGIVERIRAGGPPRAGRRGPRERSA